MTEKKDFSFNGTNRMKRTRPNHKSIGKNSYFKKSKHYKNLQTSTNKIVRDAMKTFDY
jgi:hypothetical protein